MGINKKEIQRNTSRTSPAINRLLKYYKWYVQASIREVVIILPIEDFYREMLRARELGKSRILEAYLKKLQEKENG